MSLKLSHIGFIHLRKPLYSIKQLNKYDINTLPDLFKSGIHLASHDLYNALLNKDGLSQKKAKKLEKTIYKYWVRSCTRPTPFGLFAGCAFVNISKATALSFDDNMSDLNITCRLDMECLYSVITILLRLPYIKTKVKYFPNNSIYQFANSIRYAKYTVVDSIRTYDLISVDNTLYLKQVLNNAKQGATIDSLKTTLKLILHTTDEDAERYIYELIEAQILVSEIEPCLTNSNPLTDLINKLETITGTEYVVSALKRLNDHLKDSNCSNLSSTLSNVRSILEEENLGTRLTKDVIQVDATFKKSYEIEDTLVSKIIEQVADLSVFTRKIQSEYLNEFKKSFLDKFDNEFIPLSIALDADIGVGYANVRDQDVGHSELIKNIHYAEKSQSQNYRNINKFVLNKYLDFAKNNGSYITITEEEIKLYGSQKEEPTFSSSMYILGNLFAKNKVLNENNFTFNLITVSGPSSSNLLGRFAHCDNDLLQGVLTSLRNEENVDKEAIYAEIVHFPQSRAGNILLRPLFRGYEIPYIGKSGANLEQQIPVNDLYVSVIENKVVLFSKRHGKIVVPRLTTAHDSDINSLPIYRFLCDLQFQDIDFIIPWDWGELREIDHLPRVVYKDIIVQKESWHIKYTDAEKEPGGTTFNDYFDKIRARLKIPNRIICKNGEQDFVIDFEHNLGIELLSDILKNKKSVILEESLFNDDNHILYNESGEAFTNEVVIPVKAEAKLIYRNAHGVSITNNSTKRNYFPGDEWLYFKVYSSNKNAEKILKTYLLPFVNTMYEKRIIEKFFFIRYYDTLPHLRIRFHSPDKHNLRNLQTDFFDFVRPLVDAGVIQKITIDTYTRELERYGSDQCIELVESLFFNDSICILNFLNSLDNSASDRLHMFFAFKGIDILLDDFNLDLNAKKDFIKFIKTAFFKEFGGNAQLEQILNDKYRTYRNDILEFNRGDTKSNYRYETFLEILSKRSLSNVPVIEQIYTLLGSNNTNIYSLVSSIIHMFMNRLFISQQRKYELVIYYLLEKHYTSQLAYLKNNQNI